MTFNSKKTLASMVGGIMLYTAYILYALGRNSPEQDNLKSWAIVMLVFIGIGIVLIIVIQILFHVFAAIGIAVKDRENGKKNIDRIMSASMVEDERDKLISLKSGHIGYSCAGLGFVASLFALAFGFPVLYVLHIIFGSMGAANLIEGIMSIIYYEKGFRNG